MAKADFNVNHATDNFAEVPEAECDWIIAACAKKFYGL